MTAILPRLDTDPVDHAVECTHLKAALKAVIDAAVEQDMRLDANPNPGNIASIAVGRYLRANATSEIELLIHLNDTNLIETQLRWSELMESPTVELSRFRSSDTVHIHVVGTINGLTVDVWGAVSGAGEVSGVEWNELDNARCTLDVLRAATKAVSS